MISERHETILDILVREYIHTAEPVASEKIARRMKRALSPASIRNVFTDLTEAGYIEQPHTSGGRVPLAQAYRFFVDRILGGDEGVDVPVVLQRMLDDGRRMQEELARHLHVISRFGTLMPLGFDELFSEPEFTSEPRLAREVGRFLDEFENFRDDYGENLEANSFDVMIGEENGIQPMRRMSVIVGKAEGDELFFIAGPLRMPYDRIITMMHAWNKKPTRKLP